LDAKLRTLSESTGSDFSSAAPKRTAQNAITLRDHERNQAIGSG
jgi:hypothetical protein